MLALVTRSVCPALVASLLVAALNVPAEGQQRPTVRELGVTVGAVARGPLNAITDVPGIEVGQAQNDEALTGCSVVICRKGAVGGIDQRGAVAGADENGLGIGVNSSRGITGAYLKGPYQCEPEKFAEAAGKAAKAARDDLNAALDRAGKLKF